MYNSLKYMTLTVQLADKRVLINRKTHGGQSRWMVSHETFLCNHEVPLIEANKVILNKFGIDPVTYTDDFATIKQYPPVSVTVNRLLYPYILKMHKSLSFRTDVLEEYRALDWYEVVDDIIKDSTHRSVMAQRYTPTAAFLTKTLHKLKVFD